VAVQEKTSEPFVPRMFGYLGQWVKTQRQRKKGAKGFQAMSKVEEDEVDSLHHALSL
jgi:hypothetical protein